MEPQKLDGAAVAATNLKTVSANFSAVKFEQDGFAVFSLKVSRERIAETLAGSEAVHTANPSDCGIQKAHNLAMEALSERCPELAENEILIAEIWAVDSRQPTMELRNRHFRYYDPVR